ncbi:glutathione S-transferase N-terminal domain-containing protein, partial [Klebsiella pneumoniae]
MIAKCDYPCNWRPSGSHLSRPTGLPEDRRSHNKNRSLAVAEPLLIIGSYLSPYVRKVLVLLELKGIAYRIDPIVPFFG